MKKLSEKELSKIKGGLAGISPVVSFFGTRNVFQKSVRDLIRECLERKHHKRH